MAITWHNETTGTGKEMLGPIELELIYFYFLLQFGTKKNCFFDTAYQYFH